MYKLHFDNFLINEHDDDDDVIDRRQTDRQTDVRQHHRLMPPPIRVGDIITCTLWNVRNIIAIILLQKNQNAHTVKWAINLSTIMTDTFQAWKA